MFPSTIEFLGRKRDKEKLADAEQIRLAKIARGEQSNSKGALRTVTNWLGSQMVKWGAKLQGHGPSSLPKVTSVVERLRGTPARMADRLLLLPRAILTRRDGDDWSIQEHAGHLLDYGELDLGRLDDYAAGLKILRPADRENRKTYAANHNANTIENIVAAFRVERETFVRRLEGFDAAFIQRTALHPRLQIPMRVLDLAYFIAEHDDHHLAQITELLHKWTEQVDSAV